MRKVSIIFLVATTVMVFLLTGCTRKKEIVIVNKDVYVTIPGRLLADSSITIPKPPKREVYILASPLDRERMLSSMIVKQYGSIAKYRLLLESLRKYNSKMKKLYEDKDTE